MGASVITVEAADALAVRAHGHDRSKAGVLFIDHVRRVAAAFDADPDPYAVPAALLHDTVEKGAMKWADLRTAGADERLLAVVDALTERDGEADRAYLARCAADPLALRVKRVDIRDKLVPDPTRVLAADDLIRLRAAVQRRLELLDQLAGAEP